MPCREAEWEDELAHGTKRKRESDGTTAKAADISYVQISLPVCSSKACGLPSSRVAMMIGTPAVTTRPFLGIIKAPPFTSCRVAAGESPSVVTHLIVPSSELRGRPAQSSHLNFVQDKKAATNYTRSPSFVKNVSGGRRGFASVNVLACTSFPRSGPMRTAERGLIAVHEGSISL